MGTVAIMRENSTAMKWWLGLSLLGPLYVVFFWVVATSEGVAVDFDDVVGPNSQAVENATASPSPSSLLVGSTVNPVPGTLPSASDTAGFADSVIVTKMIVITVLTILNRAVSVLFGIRAWNNFGKGLMDKVFDRMWGGGGDSGNRGQMELGESNNTHSTPVHGRGPSIFNDADAVNVMNKQ